MFRTKRKTALLCLILFFLLFPLSASLRLGASLTPSFLWDGYPLLRPNAKCASQTYLDSLEMENTWETLQDALLRFERRESMASAFLEIENGGFSFALKADLREELYNFTSNTAWSNIPYVGNTEYAVTNAQYPRVAYAEYNSSSFSVSAGRRLFSIAPGEYSFILSPSQPYLDYASFGLVYSDKGYDLRYKFWAFSSANVVFTPSEKTDVMKTIFVHRVTYERKNFIAGLSELNCVYDTVPSLVDFTPFVLWHNQYQEEHSNVMIEVSLETRFDDLRFWALYAQDDICLKRESNNLKPTALGFAFGLDWLMAEGEKFTSPVRRDRDYIMREKTLRTDGGLHLEASAYWATNWLYNRRSAAPDGSFTSDRYGKIMFPYRYYSSNGAFTDVENCFYLGFPYGPGTVLGELSLSYENEDFRLEAALSLLLRGNITIDTLVESSSKGRWLWLEGDILRLWTAALEGEWIPFSSWRNFSLTLSSSFSFDSKKRFYPLLSLTAGTSF